jgi:prophage maintenance system killer protein
MTTNRTFEPLEEQRVAPDDIPAQIIRLDAILQRASCTYDTGTIERLITPDFTLVTTTSRVMDRAAFLADVADRSITWYQNESRSAEVRSYNAACAIIVATLHSHYAHNGSERKTAIRFTDTWVNLNGYWYYAAGHATAVPS